MTSFYLYIEASGHFMKICVARTFLVELHLDDVFEVLLMVGFKFSFTELVDTYHRMMIDNWRRYLTFQALIKEEEEANI